MIALYVISNIQGHTTLYLSDYNLVWSDEFNNKELNKEVWSFRNKKRADAISTENNTKIENGKLIITIDKKDTNFYTSDLTTEYEIDSKNGGNKLDFLYGYFEARMKLPMGEGNNPAFWLNSKGMIQGVLNDLKNGGAEIDIFEHSFLHPDEAVHSIWINGYGKEKIHIQEFAKIENLQNGWHTFGLLWEPNKYTFFIDGIKTFETHKNVSSSKQYICISNNVHMDSKWLGDIRNNNFLPTTFEIDYVRVYQKKK